MSNTMTFDQVSTVLNSIQEQATGHKALTATDTASFVTQAQKTLQTGYDPVLKAISQVMSRPIFSVRPYTAKFKGLQKNVQEYGNHVRKINFIDSAFVDDTMWTMQDGDSIDQYEIHTPKTLQTNFYGSDVWSKPMTVFKTQLKNAFTSPTELAGFISGIMSNLSDVNEQARENMARMLVANMIGAKISADTPSVIKLLTEYNAASGLTLTAQTVYNPDNFPAFIKWAYARIASICSFMSERTELFHINISGSPIKRHTPQDRLHAYMLADNRYQIEARVLADTFHDNYLKFADVETVNFWQSAKDPAKINVSPNYLNPANGLVANAEPVVKDNVFAVIFDDDAMGYTTVDQSMDTTPFNARGKYSNIWIHETRRYWTDMTENCVVFLLE